ncbi:MAG: hypothetical protein WC708_18620 [Lentisphaeria bacterium]
MNNATPDPSGVSPAVSAGVITDVLMKLATQVPGSTEATADEPLPRAQALARHAAAKAAAISGSLALPPGPLGLVTVLPDLITIWKVQQQLVADIAAVYGKQAALRQELMVYCLFKHGAAHLARELVVRVGQRYLVKQATRQVLQNILKKIGVSVTQRVLGKSLSRYVPVLGALAIGAYAYYDTAQVAKTAIETFSRPVVDGADKERMVPTAAGR